MWTPWFPVTIPWNIWNQSMESIHWSSTSDFIQGFWNAGAQKTYRFPQPWKENHWTVGSHQQIFRYHQHSTALSRVPRLLFLLFQVVRGPLDVERCSKPTSQPEPLWAPLSHVQNRVSFHTGLLRMIKNGILSWMMILLNIRILYRIISF